MRVEPADVEFDAVEVDAVEVATVAQVFGNLGKFVAHCLGGIQVGGYLPPYR